LPALLLIIQTGWGQERKVVQITGVVTESDTLKGIPFATVRVKGTNRGTVADFYGFFSIVSREADTLVFSSVGYEPRIVFLPARLEDQNYYMMVKMDVDTIQLKTVRVGPVSKEGFADAFLNLKIKDDDYERAMKNLSQQELDIIRMGTPMDGSTNFKNVMHQRNAAMYSAGGLPSPSFLNPFAWAQFFKAIKQGKFKDPYKDIRN
jgi:hypothetical protein